MDPSTSDATGRPCADAVSRTTSRSATGRTLRSASRMASRSQPPATRDPPRALQPHGIRPPTVATSRASRVGSRSTAAPTANRDRHEEGTRSHADRRVPARGLLVLPRRDAAGRGDYVPAVPDRPVEHPVLARRGVVPAGGRRDDATGALALLRRPGPGPHGRARPPRLRAA